MQLQQLKYFTAVVEHKSFSKAAVGVRISQPSLSQSIQALEAELGFDLLNRTREGAFPTTMGELVYRDVKEILMLVTEKAAAWQAMFAERCALTGTVRMACMPAVYPILTEYIVKQLKQTYPNLDFKVQEIRNNLLFAYLLDNEVDVVLGGFMHRKRGQMKEFAAASEIEMLELHEDAYKIAVSVRSRYAEFDDLPAAVAAETPLACYADSDDVADQFFSHGFDQKLKVGYNSFEKIIRAALADKSASVLPELPTLNTLKLDSSYKGALRFMTVGGFSLPFTHYLCYRRTPETTSEFTAVKEIIQQTFAKLPELAGVTRRG